MWFAKIPLLVSLVTAFVALPLIGGNNNCKGSKNAISESAPTLSVVEPHGNGQATSITASAASLTLGGKVIITKTEAVGGAIQTDASRPMLPEVEATPAPAQVTISMINNVGVALSTSHASNAGPAPIGGKTEPGTIAASATVSYVVPSGWAGMVAVVRAGSENALSGDESKIETSFVVPNNYTRAVVDVDVSYVDGHSVPILCKCGGVVTSGCTADLWTSTCPLPNKKGSCRNPLRADNVTKTATPWFSACSGKAYTFPNDHTANSFGKCQGGTIVCCIGGSCT